jgi:hypothetical protein
LLIADPAAYHNSTDVSFLTPLALAGDACLVIGGRAGTISEVCLAWLHHRPLLPLTGCGGWSDRLEQNPPDERGNSKILAWSSIEELATRLTDLGLRG